jgi:glycine betaine/proline transport system ATP-binding protein
MKDGAIEQCDTPDEIVMHPQTEYVRKFTEDIDKARVVHARGLSKPVNGSALEGPPVDGKATIQDLARQLVNDTREEIPVSDKSGQVIGVMHRKDALDLLLGTG